MSAILDGADAGQSSVAYHRAGTPQRTRRPTTLLGGGPVVALRQRPAIGLGSLAERALVTGDRLVTAHDEEGHVWWIPADAVWSDCEAGLTTEHPRPIGLATAAAGASALVKGLSDRLGWEALLELERGRELPRAASASSIGTANALVLDGRLDHDVPTVVILGADTVRWGAGATWDGAVRRALYGDDHDVDARLEARDIGFELACSGLGVVTVDLGSDLLRAAGLVRCSVQLVPRDGAVRSWDADAVN